MNTILAQPARNSPLEFTSEEAKIFIRVLAQREELSRNCCQELFFGIFFDGTNNNEERDTKDHAQSNVARLSRTFPKNEKKAILGYTHPVLALSLMALATPARVTTWFGVKLTDGVA